MAAAAKPPAAEKKGGAAAAAPAAAALPPPSFWPERISVFERLYAAQLAKYESMAQDIKVTLPDGKIMDGRSFITTPLEIAKRISNSLPDKVFVAKVNDTLWDLGRPLEADCKLELLDWDDKDAREVFWHSSSHVLGYAMERVFNCKLVTGPPLEDGGFFYEADTLDRTVSEADYKAVETAALDLVRAKAPYQRLVLSKADALSMFHYNSFKYRTLAAKVPEGGTCTVYRCGELIDPCRGPHLPDTGRVKAFAVTKNSSSYFQGKAEQEVLQRLYAISFPKDSQLKEWKEIQAEAAKRDHRVIGKQQELFYFHDVSPGSAFWFPHGARIYNTLVEFQRKQYRRRGFEEVISPNIYNAKLWMVSGHWELYKDCMFTTVCEKEDFGLKPMNCPGHCIMFGARPRSYRELPIRFADFGVLHRNELSGALTGLTRVRRFQQDDAHIFCRLEQVKDEIEHALEFIQHVYGVFGFNFFLKLSTKPDNALGDPKLWEVAEAKLAEALNRFCGIPTLPDPVVAGTTMVYDGSEAHRKKLKRLIEMAKKDPAATWTGPTHPQWEVNPGDGAFYGPKIDIVVEDALKRRHQCATIQLDFNLPRRFGLKYTLPGLREGGAEAAADPLASVVSGAEPASPVTPASPPSSPAPPEQHHSASSHKHGSAPPAAPDAAKVKALHMHIDHSLAANEERPVMIHRAIFGSLERCIAILCEHFAGKWPFWLSPRQAIVIPVAQAHQDYAVTVKNQLMAEGFFVDVDVSAATLEKKIRDAQLAQNNFILVVGQEEMAANSVNVRSRDSVRHGTKTVDELIQWFSMLARTYAKDH